MLDLKYRPTTFDAVIGSKSVVSLLKNRSRKGTISDRCLMFGGPKGCGKTTLARILARASICSGVIDGNPCNTCESCVSHLKDLNTSIIEIDAATSGTVDRIREIIDELDYATMGGARTVLILDEAHRLSPSSQDAMLKAMEDRRVFAILCTTEPHKIRPALRDRVDEFVVKPPEFSELFAHVKMVCDIEGIKYDDVALELIIKHNHGMPRSVLNSIAMLSEYGRITDDAIREFFRYGSVDLICSLFRTQPAPKLVYEIWENLTIRESATWIRDQILVLISDSMRSLVGVKPKFNHDTSFIDQDNIDSFRSLGVTLAKVEKPSIYELESIILGFCLGLGHAPDSVQIRPMPIPVTLKPDDLQSHRPTVPVGLSQIPSLTHNNQPVTHGMPVKVSKSIEIDGVLFSSEEKLTSLHDKITPGRGPSMVSESDGASVQYDGLRVPMSEQEFTRVFTERVKA